MAVTAWTSEGMDWSSENALILKPLAPLLEALRLALRERLALVSEDGFLTLFGAKLGGAPSIFAAKATEICLLDPVAVIAAIDTALSTIADTVWAWNDVEIQESGSFTWNGFPRRRACSCWLKPGAAAAFASATSSSDMEQYMIGSTKEVYDMLGINYVSYKDNLALWLRNSYRVLNALNLVWYASLSSNFMATFTLRFKQATIYRSLPTTRNFGQQAIWHYDSLDGSRFSQGPYLKWTDGPSAVAVAGKYGYLSFSGAVVNAAGASPLEVGINNSSSFVITPTLNFTA